MAWAFVAAVVVLLQAPSAAQAHSHECSSSGTPSLFEELVLGRCLDWIVANGDHTHNLTTCSQLWNAISSVSRSKDPSTISKSDWLAVLKTADYKAPPNATLFWSGTGNIDTGDVVHLLQQASNRKFVTLEGTLGGSLLNNISWCGSTESSSGWNDTCCPWLGGRQSYWQTASSKFASSVKGSWTGLFRAYKLDDGTIRRVYGNSPPSFFEEFELPNIPDNNRGKITVLIVRNPEIPEDTCKTGTGPELLKAIAKRFPLDEPTCIDDPQRVTYLICAAVPDSPQCDYLKKNLASTASSGNSVNDGEVVAVAFCCFLLGVAAVALIWYFRHRKQKNSTFPERSFTTA